MNGNKYIRRLGEDIKARWIILTWIFDLAGRLIKRSVIRIIDKIADRSGPGAFVRNK